jgi:hypothetical protein
MAGNERIIQGLLNARTTRECISALQDANPTEEAGIAPQLDVVSAAKLLPLQQLIIWPGEYSTEAC